MRNTKSEQDFYLFASRLDVSLAAEHYEASINQSINQSSACRTSFNTVHRKMLPGAGLIKTD